MCLRASFESTWFLDVYTVHTIAHQRLEIKARVKGRGLGLAWMNGKCGPTPVYDKVYIMIASQRAVSERTETAAIFDRQLVWRVWRVFAGRPAAAAAAKVLVERRCTGLQRTVARTRYHVAVINRRRTTTIHDRPSPRPSHAVRRRRHGRGRLSGARFAPRPGCGGAGQLQTPLVFG